MEQDHSPRDNEVGRTPQTRAELEELRDAMQPSRRPPVTETERGAPLAPDPRPGGGPTAEMDELPNEEETTRGLQRVRDLRRQLQERRDDSV